MSTENMNGSPNGHQNGHSNGHENGHVTDEKVDVGIAPGLHGEYVDPHLKAQREYESDYAKLALKGGHKGLLSMNGESEIATTDDPGRRQKGCHNLSEYNKIAHQGGHKDLLKIAEDQSTPPKSKIHSTRTCGDWYSGNSGIADNNNIKSPPKSPVKNTKPTSPEPDVTPIRDQRRSNGNCIVPGGPEEAPRFGKKRFNNPSQRQEAPFATNF